MQGIWKAGVWLGSFLVFVVVMFIAMKVIKMISEIMEKSSDRDNKWWIFTFLRYFPFFVISIPLVSIIYETFNTGITEDFSISSKAYQTLIVEQSPMIAGFIIGWTIIYILTIMAFENSEVVS